MGETQQQQHGGNGATGGELLTKDAILNAHDMQYEVVDVPEWGGKVRVKSLAAIERDDFEKTLVSGAGKYSKVDTTNIRAKLCARAIVDAAGNRLFSDLDVLVLGAKSAAALDRVYGVAARLSKISTEDIEELQGNSKSGHSDAS